MERDTWRANLDCLCNGHLKRIGNGTDDMKQISKRLQMVSLHFGMSPAVSAVQASVKAPSRSPEYNNVI